MRRCVSKVCRDLPDNTINKAACRHLPFKACEYLFVRSQRLFVLIVVGLITAAILVLFQNKEESSQFPPAQSDETVILQGVRQLETVPVA